MGVSERERARSSAGSRLLVWSSGQAPAAAQHQEACAARRLTRLHPTLPQMPLKLLPVYLEKCHGSGEHDAVPVRGCGGRGCYGGAPAEADSRGPAAARGG
mmetsp:Transcript_5489/g.10470  ORF Transcript_5489/g.10470 Transcript_5489/m.10470 type:complete len:101 (+) Transcript_5489:1305-1607(+)